MLSKCGRKEAAIRQELSLQPHSLPHGSLPPPSPPRLLCYMSLFSSSLPPYAPHFPGFPCSAFPYRSSPPTPLKSPSAASSRDSCRAGHTHTKPSVGLGDDRWEKRAVALLTVEEADIRESRSLFKAKGLQGTHTREV